MTITRAWLAERHLTVVEGKVVPIDDVVAREAARSAHRPEFPDPKGCWTFNGVWYRAAELSIDTEDLEGGNQAQIRKLFIARGCHVDCLSQYRKSAVAKGIPDLWIFGPDSFADARSASAWWWETKRPRRGVFSNDQLEFALRCHGRRVTYGAGPASAALQFANFLGLKVL